MDTHPTHEIDSEMQWIVAKLRNYSDRLQGNCSKEKGTQIYKKAFPLVYKLRSLRRIVDSRWNRTTYN